MTSKRTALIAIAVSLLVLMLASPASAKQLPVTKMTFKLGSHQFVVGDTITATVHVTTRDDHHWADLPAVAVNVMVDGDWIATVITDPSGVAQVSLSAGAVGDHVMKIVFMGDGTHKRAQRAQGFTIAAAA